MLLWAIRAFRQQAISDEPESRLVAGVEAEITLLQY